MAPQSSILSSVSSAYNSIYYYPLIKRSSVITNVTNSRKFDTPILSQDFNMKTDELMTYTVSSKNDVTYPVILRRTETTAAAKLYAVLEAVADRVEMHTNVGEQRNNWNSLLLNSINMMTLTATTMAALTAAQPVPALKLSSAVLFAAATGLLAVMNKLQPSQLVEEQRSATRLFKQLHEEIQTMMALKDCVTETDVKYMMERVLALDKAYPLPLIGVMLEKFPEKLEPSVWWPLNRSQKRSDDDEDEDEDEMKHEMKEIVRVLKEKDKHEYIRLGNTALKMNKVLSKLGPLLTAMAATGSVISDSSSSLGVLAMAVAVGGGALSTIVNSIEHGGQLGMVVEMYRNNAGFFRFMEESIESSNEENSELMKMKVGLQLGRSLSQLKELAMASSSSRKDGNSIDEFASKLF